jgi:hypothetical protein
MTTTPNKPATSFWVVSALALVWNIMGVMAYLAQVMMTPEALQALSAAEQEYYKTVPAWATGAFALAVWGGALGSLLLLLRLKLATIVFIISLAGILIQMFHSFFIGHSYEIYGPGGLVMPIMILIIGIALIWYSRKVAAKGWLK